MNRMRLQRVIWTLLILAMIAAACGDDDSAEPAADEPAADEPAADEPAADEPAADEPAADELDREATLRFSTVGGPDEMDPMRCTLAQTAYTRLSHVYDRLVMMRPDFSIAPMLATSWDFSEDGREISFTLRDDVTFHDGTKFDAEAVKLSLERAKTLPESTVSQQLTNIIGVEVVDPTHVVFQLENQDNSMLTQIALDVCWSAIISPKAIQEGVNLSQESAGSGPYVWVESTADTVIYERFPEYWDPDAGLVKRMELVNIPNGETRLNAVLSGQVDLAVYSDQPARLDEAEADGFQVARFFENPFIWSMQLNIGDPALEDVRVRQALNLAVDREELCQIFEGAGRPTVQIFGQGIPGHIPELDASIEFNPERARELLEEAGVPDLTFDMISVPEQAQPEALAVGLQGYFADVGITVNLIPTPGIDSRPLFQGGTVAPAQASTTETSVDPGVIVEHNVVTREGVGGTPDYLIEMVEAASRIAPGPDRVTAYEEINRVLVEKPIHVPVCNGLLALIGGPNTRNLTETAYGRITFSGDLRYHAIAK